ncbi:hypothetical protein CHU92_14015 [Flavobacterium cyanobacteriorum]|uniref:LysM domain-containing protein n=1 Tax=Flavobacterium cyanobacteriorum TaxID=2022802 RepID=A0A255YV32_9FLAO|nr:LysM domain-containing protein [Flavobacterium cyanobacteriorum]OYQ33031.1 hypothetical protein CHU92_14015 [Flavobacterium cyanobacteriorum]
MKAKLILVSSLLVANFAMAAPFQLPQQNSEKETSEQTAIHHVALGETMVIIAKKYMVLPQDIYELNPDAVNGISQGMMLRIPVGKKVKVQAEEKNLDYQVVDAATILKDKQKKQQEDVAYISEGAKIRQAYSPKTQSPVAESKPENVNHEVKPGETLSGLAKKYNTTIAEITSANSKMLKRGLQAGQVLVIPATHGEGPSAVPQVHVLASQKSEVAEMPVTDNPETHYVKPGETLHSLARKYGLTVAEITAANEKLLKRGLQAGQTLVIPGGNKTAETETVLKPEPVIVTNYASYSDEPVGTTEHKVVSGETLIGLAKKYNTTVDAITTANQKLLKKGLQAGQTLKIPVPVVIADNVKE